MNQHIGYPDYLGNDNNTKLENDYAEVSNVMSVELYLRSCHVDSAIDYHKCIMRFLYYDCKIALNSAGTALINVFNREMNFSFIACVSFNIVQLQFILH